MFPSVGFVYRICSNLLRLTHWNPNFQLYTDILRFPLETSKNTRTLARQHHTTSTRLVLRSEFSFGLTSRSLRPQRPGKLGQDLPGEKNLNSRSLTASTFFLFGDFKRPIFSVKLPGSMLLNQGKPMNLHDPALQMLRQNPKS